MDSRFIDSFVMVAECGSIAEASRRLNMTPSALAQRIRVLEQDFGVTLLTRSGRNVSVTEAGMRLLSQARTFQREVKKLRDAAINKDFIGGLQIGSIRTALSNVVPALLQHAISIHPSLNVFIEAGMSEVLYHDVAGGKLDAAIIVAPPFRIPKSLVWYTLRREPLVVLSPGSLSDMDGVTALTTQPLIRYDRRGWGGSLADQYLYAVDIQPSERIELDSLDGILELISMGLGVSLIPDWFSPTPLPNNITVLPLNGEAPYREVGLLCPAQSPYNRLFEGMVTAAVALAGRRI